MCVLLGAMLGVCKEPPIYSLFFFFPLPSAPADCPDSVPSSTETGGTNCLAPGGLSGKTSLVVLDLGRGSGRVGGGS